MYIIHSNYSCFLSLLISLPSLLISPPLSTNPFLTFKYFCLVLWSTEFNLGSEVVMVLELFPEETHLLFWHRESQKPSLILLGSLAGLKILKTTKVSGTHRLEWLLRDSRDLTSGHHAYIGSTSLEAPPQNLNFEVVNLGILRCW